MAAPIVRRIFRMTLEGYGPYQIATQFTAEHIPVPAYHQAQLGVGLLLLPIFFDLKLL